MMEIFGLTADQLMMLVGLGLVMLVALFVLKVVVKLTQALLRVGCLVVLVLFIIAFFAMRG